MLLEEEREWSFCIRKSIGRENTVNMERGMIAKHRQSLPRSFAANGRDRLFVELVMMGSQSVEFQKSPTSFVLVNGGHA